MKKLTFEESIAVIKANSCDGLQIQCIKKSISYDYNGEAKNRNVTTFTVFVGGELIYELPGSHIPTDFIESGSWEESNNIEILLNQYALRLLKDINSRVGFELNENNTNLKKCYSFSSHSSLASIFEKISDDATQ